MSDSQFPHPAAQRQSLGLVDGQCMPQEDDMAAYQLVRLADEFRTPLSTIVDMTDILLAKNLPAPERRSVESIRHAADALLKTA